MLRIQRSRRDDEVDMGMKVQLSRMGVEHRMCADPSLQLRIIQAELHEGLPAEFQQQIVADALVLPHQLAQLIRQCEGHHEIVDRKQFSPLAFQPLLAFMMLAVRAIAMTTGVWDDLLRATIRTVDDHHGALFGATFFHGVECPMMSRQ